MWVRQKFAKNSVNFILHQSRQTPVLEGWCPTFLKSPCFKTPNKNNLVISMIWQYSILTEEVINPSYSDVPDQWYIVKLQDASHQGLEFDTLFYTIQIFCLHRWSLTHLIISNAWVMF